MDTQQKQISVSVIVPVYNAARWVGKCIESVLAQNLTDLEVICVDDGSVDESYAVAEHYAKRDERVRVIRQENSGPSAARNCGLRNAVGRWIAFVDADDWLEPDMLRTMVDRAEQGAGSDIVICTYYEEFSDGQSTVGKHFPEDQFWDRERIETEQRKFFCKGVKAYRPYVSIGYPWGRIYRRAMLQEHSIRFPENVFRTEDGIFNLYAFQHSRQMAYINRPLYHYRVNEGSISHGLFRDVVRYTEADFDEVHKFAAKYKQDDAIFLKGIDVRICTWFYKYLAHYYFHPAYLKEHGYLSARQEVLALLSKEYYRQAYRTVDFSLMSRGQKLFVFFAKYRMVDFLYLAVEIKMKQRQLEGK